MSEIALRNDPGNTVAVPAERVNTSVLVSLAQWAQELDAAGQIAVKLCQTPFVPAHFRNKAADAAAAILTGHELGLSPMASLRSIFLISGNPGMYAKVMVAIVQSHGHEVWIPEQSAVRVVVRGRRRGSPHVFETVWDRDRVVQAKLTGNAKYQESPQQMMVARGQAEICRQVAADALHGVPYAVEELDDFRDGEQFGAAAVTASEILAIGGQPADVPSPGPVVGAVSANAEPVGEPDVPPGPAMITAAQQRRLHAMLTKTGRKDRDIALVYISGVLDREVTSTKQLTEEDANKVIRKLGEDPPEPPEPVQELPATTVPPPDAAEPQRPLREVQQEQSATLRSMRSLAQPAMVDVDLPGEEQPPY